MWVSLSRILASYGLELNATKTKLLSTTQVPTSTAFIDTGIGFLEHVHATGKHKYLGRCFSGELRDRGQAALDHRASCAWMKFRALQSTLTNKHVNLKLRLRLFDAVIMPSICYAMETIPLTKVQAERLNIGQEKCFGA